MDNKSDSMKHAQHLALSYLYGGSVHYRRGETLGPRVLPDWEVVLIIEGQTVYSADNREYVAPPGSLILARPGFREAYRWDPVAETHHAYFHFGVSQMPSDWPELTKWPVIRTQPDPVLPALFRHVMQRIQANSHWPSASPGREGSRHVEALIDAFLEKSCSGQQKFEHTRPEPVGHAIELMRSTLDEDPGRSLKLGDLADAAGVTQKHLCRLFQTTLGNPPMRTYQLLKLQLAVALLSRSNLTIKQIAHRCGFECPFYFSRSFSKEFGQSPTEVRKQIRRGKTPPTNPLPVDITPRIYW